MTDIERLTKERDEARAEVEVLDKLMRQHRTASVGTIDRLEETEAELREEIRRLNNEVSRLRQESLRLATDLERAEKKRDEASLADGWMPRALHRAERECDEARAEVVALKAVLKWYVENDDTREDGMFAVYNAASINNKRRAMRLLGLLEAT